MIVPSLFLLILKTHLEPTMFLLDGGGTKSKYVVTGVPEILHPLPYTSWETY